MANYIIETFDISKKYKISGKKKEILALDNVNIARATWLIQASNS